MYAIFKPLTIFYGGKYMEASYDAFLFFSFQLSVLERLTVKVFYGKSN